PASARARANSSFINRQNFRMLLDKPNWRRGGRRAENDLQLALPRHLDAIMQPVELDLSRPRLHREPRELPHVHDLQPHRRDVIEVALPLLARPLLGIVIDADFHMELIQSVSFST